MDRYQDYLGFNLPTEMLRILRARAKADDRSVASYMRRLIQEDLRKHPTEHQEVVLRTAEGAVAE